MHRSLMLFGVCVLPIISALAQTQAELPTVLSFACPQYPKKAQSMRLQGAVRMEVTTDGHHITNIRLFPSPPVLSEEAVKNVKSWRFLDHQPTTFLVTYNFSNDGQWEKDPVTDCAAKVDLPTEVDVSTKF